jgi:hypothetical protein
MTTIQTIIEKIEAAEATLNAVKAGAKIESIFAEFAADPNADMCVSVAEATENVLGLYRLLKSAIING